MDVPTFTIQNQLNVGTVNIPYVDPMGMFVQFESEKWRRCITQKMNECPWKRTILNGNGSSSNHQIFRRYVSFRVVLEETCQRQQIGGNWCKMA